MRFGVYEADFRAGELRRRGVRITLQDQPLQILEMLLEHPGDVVTRDELQKRIWPADTFVDFEQGLYNAIRRLRTALKDSPDRPHFIETLARRGYRFIGTVDQSPRRIESLVVLPLENLSGDPGQDYFAEGLTESLITTLARIGELRVVSRTSSMQYKATRKPLPEIARELQVDGVVEGTVLRAGRRLRISAQLVDASREAHLWAETYERDLRDVLHLQAELAQAIAREIRVRLNPIDAARLARAHAVDPDAYEAFLKGRHFWNQRPSRLGEAMKCFRTSLTQDPTYAPAYAGLAECLVGLHAWGLVPPEEGSIKAKAMAERSLEIDAGSAEAHAALALATMYHFEFADAEKEFERALELNPRLVSAHQHYGWFLSCMGRYEESYTEYQRAIRLDPLFSTVRALFGWASLYARRFDQAIDQFLETIELDPTSGPALCGLGTAYRCKGRFEPAIEKLRRGAEFWPGTSPPAWLGEVYAAAGQREEALRVLQQLRETDKYVTPYGVARIHAALGESDRAFEWLETSYRERAGWLVLLKVDPVLDVLRSDPRFEDLLQRMSFQS